MHLDNLADHEAGNVVAVCDIDEETAESAAEPHDAAVYTDFEQLYATEKLDAVFVCVPPFAHGEPELMAADRGIDLFVEKPLALESETAREIEAAIEDAEILTQVGHMNRYADIVTEAEALVGDRTLALVDGHWWSGVPGTAWWRVKAQSGGQVVEQSTHTFDVVRYFAGDVARVRAAGGRRVVTEAIDFSDATSATITHENDVVSHVSSTSTAPNWEQEIQLIGDGFSLELNFGANTLSGTVDGEEVQFEGSGETYGPELDAFLEAVETRDGSLLCSPYSDARKTFETTLAVNESIETGEPVEVDA